MGHKWRLKALWEVSRLFSNASAPDQVCSTWLPTQDSQRATSRRRGVGSRWLCIFSSRPGSGGQICLFWTRRDAQGVEWEWLFHSIQLLQTFGWGFSDFPFPPSNLQGYDILLDDALHPHLLEINNRPSIFTKPVDMAVNKPMVEEMFRLVGYHLPPSAVQPEFIEVRSMFWTHWRLVVGCMFNLWNQPWDSSQCYIRWRTLQNKSQWTGEDLTLKKEQFAQDMKKQERYSHIRERHQWVNGLGNEPLLPADLRCLIKVAIVAQNICK